MRIVIQLDPDDQPTPQLRRLVADVARVAPRRTAVVVTRSHLDRPVLRDVVADFVVMGSPKPKERPRFGRHGNVYTPAATVRAERAIGAAFDAAVRAHRPMPRDRYAVQLHFCKTADSPGDADNMVKTVLDGLNGRAWIDDRAVCWIEALRTTGTTDRPYTRVTVYRLETTT